MERLKMYDKFIPERKGGIGLSDLCQPDKVWFGDKPDWFLYTVTGSCYGIDYKTTALRGNRYNRNGF